MRAILVENQQIHPFGTRCFTLNSNKVNEIYAIVRESLLDILISGNHHDIAERLINFRLIHHGKVLLESDQYIVNSDYVFIFFPKDITISRADYLREILSQKGIADPVNFQMVLSLESSDKLVIKAYLMTIHGFTDPVKNLEIVNNLSIYQKSEFRMIRELLGRFHDPYQLWKLLHHLKRSVSSWEGSYDDSHSLFQNVIDRSIEFSSQYGISSDVLIKTYLDAHNVNSIIDQTKIHQNIF